MRQYGEKVWDCAPTTTRSRPTWELPHGVKCEKECRILSLSYHAVRNTHGRGEDGWMPLDCRVYAAEGAPYHDSLNQGTPYGAHSVLVLARREERDSHSRVNE